MTPRLGKAWKSLSLKYMSCCVQVCTLSLSLAKFLLFFIQVGILDNLSLLGPEVPIGTECFRGFSGDLLQTNKPNILFLIFILLRFFVEKSVEFSARAWGGGFSLAELGFRTERKGIIVAGN